jgi:DNA polymerase-3 subunit alpha
VVLNFANLHGHSTLSTGDGYQMPIDHVRRVAELGQPAIALTEHGNVSSHVKLEQACIEHGVKPIFGVELYCDIGDARGQTKHHLTVLAATQSGYSNLLGLVSESWENFRYKPTTTGEMLARYSEGLIVLSGCLGGRLASAVMGGKGTEEKSEPDLRAGAEVAARFRELLGDRYYFEVQGHPLLDRQRAYNQALARLSSRMRIPLVVTGDTHYPLLADQEMYPVLHAIDRHGRNNTVEAQSQGWEYGIELTHHSAATMLENLHATGVSRVVATGAVEESLAIAERCNVSIPKLKDLVFPGRTASDDTIRRWLRAGWRYRGLDNLPPTERRLYLHRMRYELELVLSKGFVDYFLVISDMVRWAKRRGIPVGPARGSAAASLVCWLLRITEVNPMLFPNLLFERFIDPNRHDLPDIDLDFDDDMRHQLREYLVRKYGADRVGNIGTFVMYKGKNSLDDVARVNQVPKWEVEAVKEKLIERASGDLRGNATIEDTIGMFPDVAAVFERYPVLNQARRLEGNVKGFSVHAAGLVVSQEPLTRSVAVYTRTDSKTGERAWACSIDKYDAEYVGALKIDVLGLTTMGMIRRCLEMAGLTLEELYAVSLDDEKVYEAFRRNEVIGVFQFDGRAMRSVNREVKPDTFAEICDINALARPGPLHSGAAAEYIMVKHGKKKTDRLHPVVERITAHTNQQIVYQEQILQVVRELGGFSWEEAAHIRKLISKKQGEQAFNRMRDKFVSGCAANEVDEPRALLIWKQLVTAGAYAFNAAHCVSYGMLAYWTMWLKVNYPLEFYCAALQKYKDAGKILDLLREAAGRGIRILPPDARRSHLTWRPLRSKRSGHALLAGLCQVRGIGEKLGAQMLAFRPATGAPEDWSWASWLEMRGYGDGKRRAIEEFCKDEDPFGVYRLKKRLRVARLWLRTNGDENALPRPLHRSEDVPYEPKRGQYTWIGQVVNRNLKDIYELHRSRTGEELDPDTVREPQYVNYVVITGEDETGPLVITVHRWGGLYERYKDKIWSINPARDLLLVKGYKRQEYRRAIYATELHVLQLGE